MADLAYILRMKITVQTIMAIVLLCNAIVAVIVLFAVSNSSAESPKYRVYGKLKSKLEDAFIVFSTSAENKKEMPKHAGTKVTKSQTTEDLNRLKPICHLSGLEFMDGMKESYGMLLPIRNWANSEGSERTLCYNDMTYQNGSITVPVAGVYHITSHVKFYVEDNRKNGNFSQTFCHQIVRYMAFSRKQIVLFENVLTECRGGINDGAHLEYPSLTGLAQLDAGDHVIVRVSHFDLLEHDRDWHYFDMYLA